jgi:hypothetical protein
MITIISGTTSNQQDRINITNPESIKITNSPPEFEKLNVPEKLEVVKPEFKLDMAKPDLKIVDPEVDSKRDLVEV